MRVLSWKAQNLESWMRVLLQSLIVIIFMYSVQLPNTGTWNPTKYISA
jgi:hypothetical protein